jgi:hypothetical protein
MKKYIIAIVLIVALSIGYYFFRVSVAKPFIQTIEQSTLPKDWQESQDKNVQYKVVKTVASGYQPQIVLIKNTSPNAVKPAKYVDSLIAGARSTITSLRINTDKRYSEEKYYSAVVSGTYYNKKVKISLVQRIFIKGEDVYSLTASYTGDITPEINSLLDQVVKEKISL